MSAEEKVEIYDAIDYLLQSCRGLAYAHQQGFVHCDIKPQNLMVTDDKVLKITDFGISRALDTITREEQADVVWGSPYYISPEQSAGKAPSPATDIYSLGVVAYELFSGQLPFEAENSTELARMHRVEIPRPLIDINPQIPDELNRIVMRCLEKDPENRYETAGNLEEDLSLVRISVLASESQPVMRQVSIQSDLEPEEPGTGKPDMATILLALLALILAGGLIPFWLYVVLSINSINR
jgi:serine/threonine-protein kinase